MDDLTSFRMELRSPLKELMSTYVTEQQIQTPQWLFLFSNAGQPTEGTLDDLAFLEAICQGQAISKPETTRLINLIARLLIHPSLTYPVLRLFRSLVIDFIARIVYSPSTVFPYTSLSKTAYRIGLPSQQKRKHVIGSDIITDTETSTIDMLLLHEFICLTFSRIIRLCPQITPLVLAYFSSNLSPFDRLLVRPDVVNQESALQIAQTCFRLMSVHHLAKCFRRKWDWQAFHRLAHSNSSNHVEVDPEIDTQIRTYAAETTAIVLHMADKDRARFVENCIGEGHPLNPVSHYLLFRVNEEEIIVAEQQAMFSTFSLPTIQNPIYINAELLSSTIVDVCGLLMIRYKHTCNNDKHASEPLVTTQTTQNNLRAMALALSLRQPVLLEGTTGSGKTALIDEMARLLGREAGVVKIHLGDQTDGKVLLGTYVCASQPGVFEWQPGVLTRAVTEGNWVVFEDVDMAPMEVVSILVPLLETRRLFVASRGETIEASPDFQLFATNTFDPFTCSRHTSRSNGLGDSLWTKVEIHPLSQTELLQVLHTRYPRLQYIVSHLLNAFELVTAFYHHPSNRSAHISGGRYMSTRDLVKWCHRVDTLIASRHSLNYAAAFFDESVMDSVFKEASDCFVAMIPDRDTRYTMLSKLCQCLGLSQNKAKYFTETYTPSVDLDPKRGISVGRSFLPYVGEAKWVTKSISTCTPFAYTMHSRRLLEVICAAIQMIEPVLLVGETGTGKTAVVQHLADILHQKLVVVNLSQQTESSDLLGGFRPVDVKSVATPIRDVFVTIFEKTFSVRKNQKFLSLVHKAYNKSRWDALIILFRQAAKMFLDKVKAQRLSNRDAEMAVDAGTASMEDSSKRSREQSYDAALQEQWHNFIASFEQFEQHYQQSKTKFMFSFIEGALVKAVRQGHWILLDEVNLASAETLESLSGLLQNSGGSLLLTERGDAEPIHRHPNFRVLACMNPATDVGKRDLPIGLRNRFTEIFVDSPDRYRDDLRSIVHCYLANYCHDDQCAIEDVVNFYNVAKQAAAIQLYDGAKTRPHYSLRTLARALVYVASVVQVYGLRRSLYEGFYMTYATLLDRASHTILLQLMYTHLLSTVKRPDLFVQQIPKAPYTTMNGDADAYVQFHAFWLQRGDHPAESVPHYILTPSVERNLNNIARAVVTRRFPVLIQGPTSSGKTSMIEYLAKRTNHKFVRINNHEHTDIQEYLGTYVSSDTGSLVFREGILIEALRKGHWIVLDELNLAPSDVLEALNRLLDDNREILIPETQEIVKPHPHFILFATQNPPGLYGGRKTLSRAFRNRFLELHFDAIPEEELETILSQRSSVAPTYCKKMVDVYRQLQQCRQQSKIFDGKDGYITLRDLFRWANRDACNYQELAENGYAILAERTRVSDERDVVKRVLETVMRVEISESHLYDITELETYRWLTLSKQHSDVVWTKAMKRLFALVSRSIKYNEPVLLVGETGCGKTTVCQLLAAALGKTLATVNCHQNSETADFLGGQRPVRRNTEQENMLRAEIESFLLMNGKLVKESTDNFDALVYRFKQSLESDAQLRDSPTAQALATQIIQSRHLFRWYDGPLVQSMKQGQMFLLDEISLGEDSVLERLNSILEPDRLLLLAERGDNDAQHIVAVEGFQFFATMNPGGDYGKKELSPALRNRFTEIWVPQITDHEDMLQILEQRLSQDVSLRSLAPPMLTFVHFFSEETRKVNAQATISMRDLLSWADFVLTAYQRSITAQLAFIHGGLMLFVDGLGTNSQGEFFHSLAGRAFKTMCTQKLATLVEIIWNSSHIGIPPLREAHSFGIPPFMLCTGDCIVDGKDKSAMFALTAPTALANMTRVLRAMQLRRSILLEGSPGVGKTSLVTALAHLANYELVRINLSDQTDLMDLFGADLPVEGGRGGEFSWKDGPFLEAMKAGRWVLLDELNLASQSVLEGLNACLDHRGAVYIPELDKTFACSSSFRVFAAQNPLNQGGGRKGLPKSFLNRFTQVYVDPLKNEDMQRIAEQAYPSVRADTLSRMLMFNDRMHDETTIKAVFGQLGSPWEFNLRDILRWLQLMVDHVPYGAVLDPTTFFDMVYIQRFRSDMDRHKVFALYCSAMNISSSTLDRYCANPELMIGPDSVRIGHALLERQSTYRPSNISHELAILCSALRPLAALAKCADMGWLAIVVGSSASGKTSLVRLLAELSGQILREFAMNSAVDTMELLGGFEQYNAVRHWHAVASDIEDVALRVAQQAALTDTKGSTLASVLSALATLRSIFRLTEVYISETLVEPLLSSLTMATAAEEMLNVLRQVPCISTNDQALLEDIRVKVNSLRDVDTASVSGKFEWVDGVLIEALLKGHWLLLDNVNFCTPSVIDRLNSLMEPNGTLMLNEQGLVNGTYRIIRPHPNFRLFMTMDPKYGEISRAMRNRGLEVYLSDAAYMHCEQDIAQLCNSIGVPGTTVPMALMRYHHALATHNVRLLKDRSMLHFTRVLADLMQRGVSWLTAFDVTSRSIYPLAEIDDQTSALLSVCSTWTSGKVWPDAVMNTALLIQDARVTSAARYIAVFDALTRSANHYMIEAAIRFVLETVDPQQQYVNVAVLDRIKTIPSASLRMIMTELYQTPVAQTTYSRAQEILHQLQIEADSPWLPLDVTRYTPSRHCLALEHFLNGPKSVSQYLDEMLQHSQLLHIQIELCILQSAMRSVFSISQATKRSRLSLAQQMWCAHHDNRKVSRHDLSHAILWPLFWVVVGVPEAIIRWIGESVCINQGNVDEVYMLTRQLRMLWVLLQVVRGDYGRIFILLERIVCTVRHVLLPLLAMSKTEDALHELSQIIYSETKPFRVLWESMHPTTLRSRDLWNVLSTVQSKLEQIIPRRMMQTDLLGMKERIQISPQITLLLVEGVATLYACDGVSVKLATGQMDVINRLPNILASLTQPALIVDGNNNDPDVFGNAADDDSSVSLEQQQKHISLLTEMFKMSLIEHAVQVTELYFLAAFAAYIGGQEQLNNIKIQASHILDTVSRTYRYPLDILPYKQVIWLNEESTVTMTESKRLFYTLSHTWSGRTWHNTASQMQVLSFTATDQRGHELLAGPQQLYSAFSMQWLSSVLCPLSSVAAMCMPQWRDVCEFAERTIANMIVYAYPLSFDLRRLHAKLSMLSNSLTELMQSEKIVYDNIESYLRSGLGREDLAVGWSQLHTILVQLTDYTPEISQHTQRLLLGRAHMLFGWLLMQIYLPSIALDPAADTLLSHEYLSDEVLRKKSDVAVRRVYNELLTSQSGDEILLGDEELLANHCAAVTRLGKLLPLRPMSDEIKLLFAELHMLKKTIFDAKLPDIMQRQEASVLSGDVQAMALVQETLGVALEQIPQRFPLYCDIVDPVVGAIEDVRYGMELIKMAANDNHAAIEIVELSFRPTLFEYHAYEQAMIMSASGTLWQSASLHIAYLQLCLRAVCMDATTIPLNPQLVQFANSLFANMLLVWQKQEEQRLLKEQEETQAFKSKAQTCTILDTPTDAEEAAHAFPLYNEDYAHLKQDDDVLNDADSTLSPASKVPSCDPAAKSEKLPQLMNDEEAVLIMRQHMYLFGTPETRDSLLTEQCTSELLEARFMFTLRVLHETNAHLSASFDYAMRSRYLLLLQSKRQAMMVQQPRAYNFYRDANVHQTCKVVSLLDHFDRRLSELLKRWPEHAVLQQLQEICTRIASFSLDSPVMRFLTGLELLVEKADGWERYASKEASLRNEITAVSQQIIDWRRFELTNWSSILDAQHMLSDVALARLWFHLYGITQHEALTESTADLDYAPLLEEFIQSASLGDFERRLYMLSAFHYQATITAAFLIKQSPILTQSTQRARMLALTLGGLYIHYAQCIDMVRQKVTERRAPIEKDLKDYIKLASWRDVNVFALKQSAAKTHRYLSKCIRKYKEVITTPVRDTCQQYQQMLFNITADSAISSNINIPIAVTRTVFPLAALDSVSLPTLQFCMLQGIETNDRIIKIPIIHRRMYTLLSKLHQPNDVSTVIESLENFSYQVISQMVDFQTSIPPADKTNKNKRALQKQLRKRALVDFLRTLKHAGLSYRSAPTQQTSIHTLWLASHSDNAAFDAIDDHGAISPDTQAIWLRASKYYQKLNMMAPALKPLLENHSPDIAPFEAVRLLGYSDYLLHLVRRQRLQLVDEGSRLWTIHSFTQSLVQQFTADVDTVDWRIGATQVSQAYFSIVAVQLELKNVEEAMKSVNPTEVSSVRADNVQAWLTRTYKRLQTLREKFEHLRSIKQPCEEVTWVLGTPQVVVAVYAVQQALTECQYECQTLLNGKLTCQPVFYPLQELLRHICVKFTSKTSSTDALSDVNLEVTPLLSILNALVESIMLAIQDVHAELVQQQLCNEESNNTISAPDDKHGLPENCILTQNNRMMTLLGKFRLADVAALCRQVSKAMEIHSTGICSETNVDIDENKYIVGILKQMATLVQQYLLHIDTVIVQYITFHKFVCKTTYVLSQTAFNLLKKGFCLPADADDQDTNAIDGGTLEDNVDGTGIGEGVGKKDVSDEIEDEEQVLGLQDAEKENEGDKQQEEQEKTKEEEGLQMENDFDADLENLELDGKEESDSDESFKDEEEGIDDTMDQVDGDQAENKVDESLWDQNEEDEQDQARRDAELKNEKVTREDNIDHIGQEEKDGELGTEDNNMGHQDEADEKKDDQLRVEEEGMDMDDDTDTSGDEENADVNDTDKFDTISSHEEESKEKKKDTSQDDVRQTDDQKDKTEKEEVADDGAEDEIEKGQNQDNDEQPEATEDGDAQSDIDTKDDAADDEEIVDGQDKEKEDDAVNESDVPMLDAPSTSADVEENSEDEEMEQPPSMDDQDNNNQQQRHDSALADAVATTDNANDRGEGATEPVDDQEQQQKQEPRTTAGMTDEQTGDDTAMEATDAVHDRADEHAIAARSKHNQASRDSEKRRQQQDTEKRLEMPNPNRQLGEALQKWKQRLDILEKSTSDAPDLQTMENQAKQEQSDGVFEYIQEDKDMHDAQTLGPADEHQVQHFANEEEEKDQLQTRQELNDQEMKDAEVTSEDEDLTNMNVDPDTEAQVGSTNQNEKKSSALRAALEYTGHLSDEEVNDNDKEEICDKLTIDQHLTLPTEATLVNSDEKEDEEEEEEINLQPYSPEELQQMRNELEQSLATWRANGQDRLMAIQLWQKYRHLTHPQAMQLCEQLRLILEPTVAAKLTGDYRTGKRLNMKKIIPYIASDFKKDKIWLRRAQPSKRAYRVLLAVDDSRSMGGDIRTVQLAYEAVAVVAQALAQLDAAQGSSDTGQLAVASFGESARVLHPFERPWDSSGGESGAAVVSQFTFSQDKTDVKALMQFSVGMFDEARNRSRNGGVSSGKKEPWQLMLVISDGVCDEHDKLRSMVRVAATEKRIMVVFVVLDKRSDKDSILNMTNVVYKPSTNTGTSLSGTGVSKMSLHLQRYMDTFPFDFYVVLRDIQSLPVVLSDALRQFFSMAGTMV